MKKELRREKGQGHIGHLNRKQDGKAKGICKRGNNEKQNKTKQIQAAAGDLKGIIDSPSVLIQTKLPRVNSCRTAFLQIYEKCGFSFYIFLDCKYCIWHNIFLSVIHVPWNRNLSLRSISNFVSFIIPFIFCLKIVPHPLAVFFFCSHLFGPLRAVRIPISLSHHYTTTPTRKNSEKFKKESFRKLSNFNFQWTKTLDQNNSNNIAFFFYIFQGL